MYVLNTVVYQGIKVSFFGCSVTIGRVQLIHKCTLSWIVGYSVAVLAMSASILCALAPRAFAQTTAGAPAKVLPNSPVNYPVSALSEEALTRPLVVAKQGSFFVGGQDVYSQTLSKLPAYAPSGTITIEQMYVSYQIPVQPSAYSLVLIHGCCLTGKTWESTPDDRMGWAEYFVRRGFPTYVIDQSGRGRSAVNATLVNKDLPTESDKPLVFAASHEDAWKIFRFGPEYPKVFAGMQFPVQAQNGLWQQMVPDWFFSLPKPNPTESALSALSIKLGKTVLISHSQSGIFPFRAAAQNTSGISAIVAIEPGACPDAGGELSAYSKFPVLVMFGDYVEQSTRWAPRLKACRALITQLKQSGGDAELLVLPDIGIKGNSHMLMQDTNNIQLADLLATWLERKLH